jgi:competence protein ComEA
MPAFTLTRAQALVLAAAALVAVLAAAHFLGGHGGAAAPSPSVAVPPLTTPTTASVDSATSPTVLVVDVAGAVRRPGIYRLPRGSRIADAIARAGGVTRHADPALVNLAAPLADGEQVLVPSGVAGAAVVAPAASSEGAPSPC